MAKLGARKDAICGLVPRVPVAAEVGADHGKISAYLVANDICDRIIVSDISGASLDKAKQLFTLRGLHDRAVFNVSDGLDAIDQPVGAIVIAGMGADTVQKILQRGLGRIGGASLILQANSNVHKLRRWLAEHDFFIDAERLVQEDRRYYVVLRAKRGIVEYSEKQMLLGPCLLKDRPPLWQDYLSWRRACMERMRGQDVRQALCWLDEEIKKT